MSRKTGRMLALPAIAGFVVFYAVPMLITIWYSVSFGMGQRVFVGLDNYRDLFGNDMFRLAVKNTLRFLLVSVPVILLSSFFLSVVLQDYSKRTRILRLAYFYPMIVPAASVILGVQILWGEAGVLNIVNKIMGYAAQDWLHSPMAFWVLCILYWWKYLGFHILIFYTRLLLIPKNYYDNANLFGAGKWESFRYITLPLMLPVLGLNTLLAVMNSFKCYKEAIVLGGNYPHQSIYMLQHFMNNNFQNLNYQKISAASVAMLVVELFCIGLVFGIGGFRAKRG